MKFWKTCLLAAGLILSLLGTSPANNSNSKSRSALVRSSGGTRTVSSGRTSTGRTKTSLYRGSSSSTKLSRGNRLGAIRTQFLSRSGSNYRGGGRTVTTTRTGKGKSY